MADIIEDDGYKGDVPGAVAHKLIRRTDNSSKECDLEADQKADPLKLVDGKPEGWEAPNA